MTLSTDEVSELVGFKERAEGVQSSEGRKDTVRWPVVPFFHQNAPCNGESGQFGGGRVLGYSQAPKQVSSFISSAFAGKPPASAAAMPQGTWKNEQAGSSRWLY